YILAKVNTSSMFSYMSNMYSVPAGYDGKSVGLQIYDNQMHDYYTTDLIPKQNITQQKLHYNDKHYLEAPSRHVTYKDNINELAMKNLAAINEVYKNE